MCQFHLSLINFLNQWWSKETSRAIKMSVKCNQADKSSRNKKLSEGNKEPVKWKPKTNWLIFLPEEFKRITDRCFHSGSRQLLKDNRPGRPLTSKTIEEQYRWPAKPLVSKTINQQDHWPAKTLASKTIEKQDYWPARPLTSKTITQETIDQQDH